MLKQAHGKMEQLDLFGEPSPACENGSYLKSTGVRRRRCMVFERNPYWNGLLQNGSAARNGGAETSKDAAQSVQDGDILEARQYVDEFLAKGQGIISIELREWVLEGIASGRIDAYGLPAHVRSESIRRRFSDLCR